jgi:hypothetical protein
MKRRDFFAAVGAVVAWPFVARARQQERSQNAGGLEEAKRRFDKISQPSEAARSDYVTRLVRMREEMARQKNDEWKAIDSEIREHPAPKDSDGKCCHAVWSANGHRRDMIISTERRQLDDAAGRRGHDPRHLAHRGNQFFTTASIGSPDPAQYTIILITKTDFVIATNLASFMRPVSIKADNRTHKGRAAVPTNEAQSAIESQDAPESLFRLQFSVIPSVESVHELTGRVRGYPYFYP